MKKLAITIGLILSITVAGSAMAFNLNSLIPVSVKSDDGFKLPVQRLFRLLALADELNLTSEQRQQIRAILDEVRPDVRTYIDSLLDNRQQLLTSTRDGQYDEAIVRPIAVAQGSIIAELIIIKSQVKADIYQILNDDQQAKLAAKGDVLLQMMLSH